MWKDRCLLKFKSCFQARKSIRSHIYMLLCIWFACNTYGWCSFLWGNGMKFFIVICSWRIENVRRASINILMGIWSANNLIDQCMNMYTIYSIYGIIIQMMIIYNSFHFQRTRENFRSIHRLHSHSFSDHLLISFARITIPLPTLHLQHLNIQVTQTYTL